MLCLTINFWLLNIILDLNHNSNTFYLHWLKPALIALRASLGTKIFKVFSFSPVKI